MLTFHKSSKTIVLKLLKNGNCSKFFHVCSFATYLQVPHLIKSPKFESPTVNAMCYFDSYYSDVYNEKWPEIKHALLMPRKPCAIINPFGNVSETEEQLRLLGAVDLMEFYESYFKTKATQNDLSTNIVDRSKLSLPSHLKVYTFLRGDLSMFPKPKGWKQGTFNETNVNNYYLMNGSSILPVLALDVESGDQVGDFCAAPGGKAVIIAFMKKASNLLCIDNCEKRFSKLKTVFKIHIPESSDVFDCIQLVKQDARHLHKKHSFDKILVDVHCTNDRRSVTKDGNNIFETSRFYEIQHLPQLQFEMLLSAVKSVKPGGCVVYSTCSLSPLQNDAVVRDTLRYIHEKTTIDVEVVNLVALFSPLSDLFWFQCFDFGIQVLPYIYSNFGPMYISKLKRLK